VTLARARAYYNQRQFDAAVNAAEQARLFAAAADAADLIGARAYLERFRESGSTDDLDNARDRLRRLDPQRLDAHERSEYVVGLGETLYFDGAYGAAADLFESILSRDGLAPEARERTLEWWASAVDEDASLREQTLGRAARADLGETGDEAVQPLSHALGRHADDDAHGS